MSIFSKKERPAFLYLLDDKIHTHKVPFYYPLWPHEIEIAAEWAKRHHLIMEYSHKVDDNIFYYFHKSEE